MNNLKLLVLLICYCTAAEIEAQNPAPEWVMLFKNEILAEEISLDGSRFAVLEKTIEDISDKVVLHFVSSNRKEIFKNKIITPGNEFRINEIFISKTSDKIAITGLTSPFDRPENISPLTIMFDVTGKELWRTGSSMIGFIDNGKSVLLNKLLTGKVSAPCFRDELEGVDYSCLRIADSFSAELKDLISFPGHLGGYGFVYIWGDQHVVISTLEGSIYFKDIKDEIVWYIPSEGLIIKSILDDDKDLLVVERGRNDSVYDKKGLELWSGVLSPKPEGVSEMPEAEIVIKFGEQLLNRDQILFWNENWSYEGMYKAQKDEINHLFHWKTFGQNFMRYSSIRYSQEKKRAIARTLDRRKVDYFNFEIEEDPATFNEP